MIKPKMLSQHKLSFMTTDELEREIDAWIESDKYTEHSDDEREYVHDMIEYWHMRKDEERAWAI